MKRPFYVHTPRNYLGESLVGPSIHQPGHTVRNALDDSKSDCTKATKSLAKAERQCREMNDQFEVETMAGMI